MKSKKLRVALVCDWLTEIGGAEQVLLEFHKLYPDAPIYTSQYRKSRIDWFEDADVRTGYLNIFPAKLRRLIAPLRQRYFKNLDLRGYDLVISITGSDAKFVQTDGVHLCYCHVPTQYYWGKYDEYLKNPGFGILNPLARRVFKKLAPKLKERDFESAKNPTKFLTISTHAKREIKEFYKRESKVVNPPVNTELFSQFVENYNTKKGKSQIKKNYNIATKTIKSQILGGYYKNIKITENQGSKSEQKFYTNLENVENLSVMAEILAKYPDGFYLNFSRQVSWKNLDLLIKTCKRLKLPLVLVGSGPEHRKLKRLAKNSEYITFVKPLKQPDLAFLSSLAKAFIFPSEEPFGIAPVEAMSAGCPVIALKKGGALDYVREGVNGFFFDQPTEKSLEKTLKKFEKRLVPLDPRKISKSVEKFSRKNFTTKIKKEINSLKVVPRGKRPEMEKDVTINLLDIKVEFDADFFPSLRRWLFMTFPAVLFFSNWPKFNLGETDSMHLELTLPLIWLALFALLNLKRALKYLKKNWKTPLLALLIPLLTLLWTSDKTRGILTAGVETCILISVLGSRDLRKDKELMIKTKKLFLQAAVLVCIFCLIQVFLDALNVDKNTTLLCANCGSNVFGFAHPNGFAIEPQFMGSLLLVPALVSLNSLLKNKNRKNQGTYLVVSLLSFTTIFLTLSRGAIFGLLLGTLILLIVNLKKIKNLLKIFATVLISLFLSFNIIGFLSEIGPTDANYVTGINRAISQLTFNQLGRTTEENPEDEKSPNSPDFNGYIAESTDRRLELSTYALKISTENPTNFLFGTGIGSAGTEMFKHFPGQGHAKEIVQNQYFETFLEIGLIGVIALVLGVITFIKLEKIKLEPVLIAILLGFALEIFFFSGFPNALHIYLLPLII